LDIYLYIERDSILHRLDPRSKMALLLSLLLLAVAAEHPIVPGVLLLCVFGAAQAGGVWRALKRVRVLLLIIGLFSMITWSLFAKGVTPLFGPVTLESLLYGLGTGLKLVATIAGSVVFLASTKNEEIATGLIRIGLPYNVAFAFSMALRLVPTFVGAGATIVQAQKSRGLDVESGTLLERIRKHLPLIVPIFASAIRSTNHLAMALESKGFGARKQRTYFLQLKFASRDWVVMAIASAMFVGFIFFRFLGYGAIEGLTR
jgi:energy-coupling factor transport system permease protein